jgi:heme a synthase
MTVIDLPASEFKQVRTTHQSVKTWLYWVASMVFIMVLIGGATRLTDSGLSITEWQPLLGALPPMGDADWNLFFEKYKQTTEFKVQNSWMQLRDFKWIFWWEWGHRMFGRLIGLAFVVPFLYFLVRGRIAARLIPWFIVLLLLGAAQGGLGWYMVKSGLADRTDVSQYRLAAHLATASLLFASILWVAMGIGLKSVLPKTIEQFTAIMLLLLILAQISFGGFVAGLDAGEASQTWPKMEGAWIPENLWPMQPAWRNVFETALTVQFVHRVMAYATLLLAAIHAWRAFNLPSIILAYAVFTQAFIGIIMLILHLPIGLALTHQAIALVVLAFAVRNVHRQVSRPVPVPDQR